MPFRIVAAMIIVAFGSAASSQAQNTTTGTNQLKKPAQEKTGTSTSKDEPTIELRNGVYYVVPKKPAPPANPPQRGPGGMLTPQHPFGKFATGAGTGEPSFPMLQLADRRAGSTPILVRTDFEEFSLRNYSRDAPDLRSSKNFVVAQGMPAARANTYLIQFRPNVTPKQRDDLFRRYDLVVKREIPNLNLFVVARRSIPANELEARSLSDVLNPPILLRIRREGLVVSATVDRASSPQTIPKASDTKVKDSEGVVHQWSWTLNPSAGVNLPAGAASTQPETLDGNWGLKAIRMPPVWTIIQNFRAQNPTAVRPKLAIVDTGFSKHEDLDINLLPAQKKDTSDDTADAADTADSAPAANTSSSIGDDTRCEWSHGNHVAGVAGAIYGNGIGVDGVIPGALIDALPVADSSAKKDASIDTPEQQIALKSLFFSDALLAIEAYVFTEKSKGTNLRVINVSMGFNVDGLVQAGVSLDRIKADIKETIKGEGQSFAIFANLFENSILMVTAAGNDSMHLPAPLEAWWSSPIAWAVKGELDASIQRPKNILIVEATDRNFQRASFSNSTGQISAPGVRILSTLSGDGNVYGLCDGTSQAAPYASGVATLLFELSPKKKPADIIDLMVKSAVPKTDGTLGAPQLDALEAVLRLSPYLDSRNDNLVRLTDLNGDGKVDILDLKEFARRLQLINDNRANGTAFGEDLNGDTVTSANECNWPVIDFNGSGTASLSHHEARRVLGEYRDDLAVMQMAWTDKKKDSATAIKEIGFDVQAADVANARVSPQACR
jgi:subtilase family protein